MKTHEELLREIEAMVAVEPGGDLQRLPGLVAAYIRHGQELLVAVAHERDEAKAVM